jgi:cytochrome P450
MIVNTYRKTFPVLIGPPRTIETDITLGGYHIPKNVKYLFTYNML